MDEVVGTVLRYDESPPGADYSPTGFGVAVASRLSDSELRAVTLEALRRLPASLVRSFLDGLLASRAASIGPTALYDSIGTGRQVDTAGVVVHILVQLLGEHPDCVAAELLRRLAAEADSGTQDRLAFGLWVLYNGETLLVREGKTVGFLVERLDCEVRKVIAQRRISPYARGTLAACLTAPAKVTRDEAEPGAATDRRRPNGFGE